MSKEDNRKNMPETAGFLDIVRKLSPTTKVMWVDENGIKGKDPGGQYVTPKGILKYERGL